MEYNENIEIKEAISMLMCLKCGEILHPNLFNAYRKQLHIRKRKNYQDDFICYNCYETFLIEVDNNIARSIMKLNQKGYKTKYCCEGHEIKSFGGYVYFKDTHVSKLPNIPIGWETEYNMYNRLDYNIEGISDFTIRYNLRSTSQENKADKIKEMINNFNIWVNELEDISK